jgi:gluconokinase
MGVAGSGKSTVGRALADSLGWTFSDADDFHPPANISKMSAGIPLSDQDRAPWLAALRAHCETQLAHRTNTVLACSALKAAYRDLLVYDSAIKLIHLTAPVELLRLRLAQRQNHFAKVELLESQLASLEIPADAMNLSTDHSPEFLVNKIRIHFRL